MVLSVDSKTAHETERLLPARFSIGAATLCQSTFNSRETTGCAPRPGITPLPASSNVRGWAMKKIAALTAAALVAVSALGTNAAEARGGGAIAAGVIGGLAAGALLGTAIADVHEGPAYGYGRPAPLYGYDNEAPPVVSYRPSRVVREYEEYEEVPAYRPRRVVRPYDAGPEGYGYRSARYGYGPNCDRPHRFGGW